MNYTVFFNIMFGFNFKQILPLGLHDINVIYVCIKKHPIPKWENIDLANVVCIISF